MGWWGLMAIVSVSLQGNVFLTGNFLIKIVYDGTRTKLKITRICC